MPDTSKVITKQQLEQIITNAPAGTSPSSIVQTLKGRGYQIEGLFGDQQQPVAAAPAPAPQKKGFMATASDVLFGRTGKFVGTAVGRGGELAAIALDPVARERALNASPEEFKNIFPFLGRNVDEKAGTVAKKTAGEAIGAAAEVAPFATGGAGGANAAIRIAKGTAYGAAGGLGAGLAEDQNAGDVAARTAKGAAVGFAFSSAAELLAKAGDFAAKKFMESALNPYKKDIGKIERLVDDQTLAERLNEKGVMGTNKQIVGKLKELEGQTADQLKQVFEATPDVKIEGSQLTDNLERTLSSPYIPKDKLSRAEIMGIIDERRALYGGDTFSLTDLLEEKRGIGARIGQKAFAGSSVELRKMGNEQIVDRAIYDNAKKLLENGSIDPGLVRSLNNDLSTYIDGINLFQKAQTRGVKLLNVLMTLAGGTIGGLAGLGGGAAVVGGGAAAAAVAAGGTYAAMRTTLAKTVNAQLSNALGKAIPATLGQQIIDRIILEMTNPKHPAAGPEDQAQQ